MEPDGHLYINLTIIYYDTYMPYNIYRFTAFIERVYFYLKKKKLRGRDRDLKTLLYGPH